MLHLPSPVTASRLVATAFQRKAAILLAIAAVSAFFWQPVAPAQIRSPGRTSAGDDQFFDNPCGGVNKRPARPGYRFVGYELGERRLDVKDAVVTRVTHDWRIIQACDCRWLLSGLYEPCGTIEYSRSFEEEICWTISGSVGVTMDGGLAAAMLAKIQVELIATAERQHCTKQTIVDTITRPPSQCFETKFRLVDWHTTVTATEVTSCLKYHWVNLATGERDYTYSGQETIHLSGTAKRTSSSGFQVAPKLCAGYVAADPDPFDSHTSTPCCNRIASCHIFQTPPHPCCGIWTTD